MVQREETAAQAAAFEAYYSLGEDRSLTKLYQDYTQFIPDSQKTPSLITLKNWSRFFHWQERIVIKNKAIADGVDRKTTKASIDRRAKWLAQAEDRINTAFNEDGSPKFGVEDNKSLNEVVKLALTLMGEPQRTEVEHPHQHEIKIIEVKESKREN